MKIADTVLGLLLVMAVFCGTIAHVSVSTEDGELDRLWPYATLAALTAGILLLVK